MPRRAGGWNAGIAAGNPRYPGGDSLRGAVEILFQLIGLRGARHAGRIRSRSTGDGDYGTDQKNSIVRDSSNAPRHAQTRPRVSRDSGGVVEGGTDLRSPRHPQSVCSGEGNAGEAIQRQTPSLDALWADAHAADFLAEFSRPREAGGGAGARRRGGSD